MSAWRSDDPMWVSERKAQWSQLKAGLVAGFYSSADKVKLVALQHYFMTGEVMEDKKPKFMRETLIDGWDKLILHPCLSEKLIHEFVKEIPGTSSDLPHIAGFLKWFIAGASNEHFDSEHGCCNGQEALIVNSLMPRLFDVDTWKQSGAPKYSDATHRYLTPNDIFNRFESSPWAILFGQVVNPCLPIQYMIDYWGTALPYVSEDCFLDSKKRLRALPILELIRHFREPRGEQGSESSAKAFRDRVYQILEAGTGNHTLDKVWQDTRLKMRPVGVAEERTLFSSTQRIDAMFVQINAWKSVLSIEHQFDVSKIEVVDIGKLLWWGLAEKLGYPSNESHHDLSDACYGGAVPAYRYRFEGECVDENGVPLYVSYDLLHLITAEDKAFDANVPQLLAVPTSKVRDGDDRGAFYATLCERQVARYIEKTTPFVCVIQAYSNDKSKGDKPKDIGSEHVWYLRGYVAEHGNKKVESLIKPWKGKRADVDVLAFRTALVDSIRSVE